MVSWQETLGKEEIRKRLFYATMNGLIVDDISKLKIPGDFISGFKNKWELKSLYIKSGEDIIPIEPQSVIESNINGWPYKYDLKLPVYFQSDLKLFNYQISTMDITEYINNNNTGDFTYLNCKCGKRLKVPLFRSEYIRSYTIQSTGNKKYHQYHSSCLLVSIKAFNLAIPHGDRNLTPNGKQLTL